MLLLVNLSFPVKVRILFLVQMQLCCLLWMCGWLCGCKLAHLCGCPVWLSCVTCWEAGSQPQQWRPQGLPTFVLRRSSPATLAMLTGCGVPGIPHSPCVAAEIPSVSHAWPLTWLPRNWALSLALYQLSSHSSPENYNFIDLGSASDLNKFDVFVVLYAYLVWLEFSLTNVIFLKCEICLESVFGVNMHIHT